MKNLLQFDWKEQYVLFYFPIFMDLYVAISEKVKEDYV